MLLLVLQSLRIQGEIREIGFYYNAISGFLASKNSRNLQSLHYQKFPGPDPQNFGPVYIFAVYTLAQAKINENKPMTK